MSGFEPQILGFTAEILLIVAIALHYLVHKASYTPRRATMNTRIIVTESIYINRLSSLRMGLHGVNIPTAGHVTTRM